MGMMNEINELNERLFIAGNQKGQPAKEQSRSRKKSKTNSRKKRRKENTVIRWRKIFYENWTRTSNGITVRD